MTTTQLRPQPTRLQATAMRTINVPMRLLLALPFRTPLSKNLMLLYLTGRRTGKSYRQPVSYVRYEGSLLTPGAGGGSSTSNRAARNESASPGATYGPARTSWPGRARSAAFWRL